MIWGGFRRERRSAVHGIERHARRLRRDDSLVTVPESQAGATFGPWADHDQRCRCTVCR